MRGKIKRAYLFAAILALLFACGVAVGQQAQKLRFAKYFAPSQATELDTRFLAMEIVALQNEVEILQEFNLPSRLGPPFFSFNGTTGKIQVLVAVHGNWADEAPLPQIEEALKHGAKDVLGGLKTNFPEISEGDVEIFFTKTNYVKGENLNKFAEYKNGQLTIRH